MKKILCFLILIVSSIAFTGCELLFDVLINDNNQTRTIEVSKNIGDVYLIKVNDTNYEIEYEKMAKVLGTLTDKGKVVGIEILFM